MVGKIGVEKEILQQIYFANISKKYPKIKNIKVKNYHYLTIRQYIFDMKERNYLLMEKYKNSYHLKLTKLGVGVLC